MILVAIANFPTEDPMTQTNIVVATWTVVPTTAPQPVRHCPTCAKPHPFASSGRVRLNANGKRLDAWLIYKCTQCDQTWNRPLLDRQPISQITSGDMEAMQQSAPAWVREHAFNIRDLKRHCTQIHHPSDFSIEKRIEDPAFGYCSKISVTLVPQWPSQFRVERVLCAGWGLSRSQLSKIWSSGAMEVRPTTKNAIRRPLRQSVMVHVFAAQLEPDTRDRLMRGLAG